MITFFLEDRLQAALKAARPELTGVSMLVRPCDPKFGDYQCTGLMGAAKSLKLNPRQLATEVLAQLQVSDWCSKVEIAGAGYLNFHLKSETIANVLAQAFRGENLFFRKTSRPQTIVIDFSSPNVAKPMHIGHIRSTNLGDSLARTFRLLGHRVVTDNHIGDWGTQFGMLLVGWKTQLDPEALDRDPIGEMERIYKSVSAACRNDPTVLEAARSELVRLQTGDPENLGLWKEMIRLSQSQFDTIYGRLGVKFDHTLGESFYNPKLKTVVADLIDQKIAQISEGATVVFSDSRLSPKEDPLLIHREEGWQPNPLLIQKSDGAANYATTDLATLQYRIETWQPDEIVYVTDGRQQLHFRQVFEVFQRWKPADAGKTRLIHAWFGSILGDDGKPFKTRSGDTVKLEDVLDEAEARALKIVSEKRPELSEDEQKAIATVVGLGAVKYQDLLPNRQSDYVFQWDRMLALTGNTAPYVQYQYTRARKVVTDSGGIASSFGGIDGLAIAEIAERDLAKQLINFGMALEAVREEYRPNLLCNYLYELAGLYSRFYEACPVLKASEPARTTRLVLCELTARVLRQGLNLLGIEVSEVM